MHVLMTLIIGMFLGAIAKLVIPGRDSAGVIVTMLLGIGGAALANFIGRSAGWYPPDDAGPAVLAAFIGAVVVLGTYRAISPRKMAPR